jgi:hypothetical protein
MLPMPAKYVFLSLKKVNYQRMVVKKCLTSHQNKNFNGKKEVITLQVTKRKNLLCIKI